MLSYDYVNAFYVLTALFYTDIDLKKILVESLRMYRYIAKNLEIVC